MLFTKACLSADIYYLILLIAIGIIIVHCFHSKHNFLSNVFSETRLKQSVIIRNYPNHNENESRMTRNTSSKKKENSLWIATKIALIHSLIYLSLCQMFCTGLVHFSCLVLGCHHYISLEVHVKSWPTGYNSQKFLLIWGLSLRAGDFLVHSQVFSVGDVAACCGLERVSVRRPTHHNLVPLIDIDKVLTHSLDSRSPWQCPAASPEPALLGPPLQIMKSC
ncbi:uncharacterized protein LOC111138251 [Crassostrea virginica]